MPNSKKQKKRQKRRAAPRQRGQRARQSRALIATSMPKSFYTVQGTTTGAIATGCEIIAKLVTTSNPSTYSVPLNPSIAAVFPRLSSYSTTWERFRFKEIQVKYYTAAPATRSGQIGIAVHTEVQGVQDVPTDPVQFCAYAYRDIGSIADDHSTNLWRNADPEYFFVGNAALAAQNPLKVFQGSVMCITADAVSGDNGALAGYLAIEYVCEFRNSRPAQSLAALWRAPDTTVGLAEVKNSVLPIPVPANESPWIGDFGASSGVSPVVGVGPWMTRDAAFASNGFFGSVAEVADGLQKGYYWASNALEYLGVGAAPGPRGSERKMPAAPLDATITVLYNPDVVAGHAGWVPMAPADCIPDEKTQLPIGLRRYVPDTAASGDITAVWYLFDGNNATPTDAITVVAAGIGTGAYTIALPPTRILLEGNSSFIPCGILPFSGDTRWVVQNALSMEYEGNALVSA
jgi:hypothetical protein